MLKNCKFEIHNETNRNFSPNLNKSESLNQLFSGD